MWLRVRQIALVANKLAPVVDDMKNVLGLEVCYRDPGVKVFGLENALFPVGNQFIEVVAPIQENTAGGRYLQRRKGDGGYMCIMQAEEHAPVKERVAKLGGRFDIASDEAGAVVTACFPLAATSLTAELSGASRESIGESPDRGAGRGRRS